MAAAPPDHDAELTLVVELGRDARAVDVVEGSRHGGHLLVEDDRRLRRGPAGLGGVVGVVEADREDLAGPQHRRAEPHVAERAARTVGARCGGERLGTGVEEREHARREGAAREHDDLVPFEPAPTGGVALRERHKSHRRYLANICFVLAPISSTTR